MSKKKVLTITMNPSLDVGSEAEDVITDEKTRCEEPVYDPGGGGINVARVLTRLGVEADALLIAGGHTGNKLIEMLEEESIRIHTIRSRQDTRQNIAIIDNSAGKQYRFVFPGRVPDESVWIKVLDQIRQSISAYDYVVASGSLPEGVPDDLYSRIGKVATDAGKKFVIDTYGEALMKGIRSGAYFIKPNKEEFEDLKELFGVSTDKDLLDKMFKSGIEQVVQTFGKEKTVLHTPERSYEFIPPTIKPRSTIGAGDSFVGGMIAGLVNGLSRDKAVCYGISAAASTLLSEGTDLCDKDEVERIYLENYGE
ncbi:1-phosphofructokinase family hexose kinase [Balneola sp. MJW-20]|uniref:1-phosphofructokinase family hexose kinase n=1 Tax=Gracilimonas aurantiaca TaxID=3234185 RepID=UPI0034669ECB